MSCSVQDTGDSVEEVPHADLSGEKDLKVFSLEIVKLSVA